MNKGVIGVTFILGFLISGYLGYQANDFKRTYEHNEETVKTAKSDDIVEMNDEEPHHDVEILTDITYWIDGVPRKATETIIRDGEVYMPAHYLSKSMGVPYQFHSVENKVTIGKSMSERVATEKFLSKDHGNYVSAWMTLDQVERVLGQPLSSNKKVNECNGNNEMTAIFSDAEILFIYDVTDKQYHMSDIAFFTENIVTDKGITVGSAASDVTQLYGDFVDYTGIEDGKGTEGISGNGLIRYGLKESLWFEVKEGKVVRFGISFPHC